MCMRYIRKKGDFFQYRLHTHNCKNEEGVLGYLFFWERRGRCSMWYLIVGSNFGCIRIFRAIMCIANWETMRSLWLTWGWKEVHCVETNEIISEIRTIISERTNKQVIPCYNNAHSASKFFCRICRARKEGIFCNCCEVLCKHIYCVKRIKIKTWSWTIVSLLLILFSSLKPSQT